MKKVVVTGAAGKLGQVVCAAFLKARWRVVGIARSKSDVPKGSKVSFTVIDLCDGGEQNIAKLSKLVRGSVAVHLAGLVDLSASRRELFKANVLTTINLLKACKKSGVARFVHCSSTSVHRTPHYLPIDEKHPFTPINDYGKTKLAAEKLVAKSGLPFVVIRPTVIYGPHFSQQFQKFRAAALSGSLPIVGSGNNRLGFVYEQDLADAFVLAATRKQAVGNSFIIASPEKITQKQALKEFCSAISAPAPARSIPKKLAYLAAKISLLKSRLLGGKPSVTVEEVHTLSEDRYYNVKKAQKLLGWKARVKFSEGIRNMVRSW